MKKFFKDDQGKPSLMRLLTFMLFIYWMALTGVLIHYGQVEFIPKMSYILLGFVFGSKALQKGLERVKKNN